MCRIALIAAVWLVCSMRAACSEDSEILQAYLMRLGLQVEDADTIQPTKPLLCALQAKHMYTFCHDTFDAYLHRSISLDPQTIIAKFLAEQRGGLCFELNGAFCCLLQNLGFDAVLVSAHVHHVERRAFHFPIDTHAVIIVTLQEKQYLVDVGFGNSCRMPLALHDDRCMSDVSGRYKLIYNKKTDTYSLYKALSDSWVEQYSFHTEPKQLIDFQNNLSFVCNAPEHWFNSNLVCTLPSEQGAMMLLGLSGDRPHTKFLEYMSKGYYEVILDTYVDVEAYLIGHFGMSSEIVCLLEQAQHMAPILQSVPTDAI